MILEAVVSTRNADASPHFSPMGYRVQDELIVLAPFVPSTTLANLRRECEAVLNLTDDVSVVAGCLTGRTVWASAECENVNVRRLERALAHKELRLKRVLEDEVRPQFFFDVLCEKNHHPFQGFNRAQAAVIEAAILLTRLEWLDPNKVAEEMNYLQIAINKTAGTTELQAWHWIVEAIHAHRRHDLGGLIA